MTQPTDAPGAQPAEQSSGFFVNAGTHTGWFTTPDGDIYDIRKREPREVTDPRNGEFTTIWGGYATARDRDLAARDAILQAVVELNTPAFVRGVLGDDLVAHGVTDRAVLASVRAQLAAEHADRVCTLTQRAIIPALDG